MRRLLLILTAFLAAAAAFAGPAQAAWLWPVRGEVITPYRNGSDPYAGGQHRGIDIAAAVGTPVVAAAAGEVRFAGTAGSSGLTVSVRTGDGFDTSYLHLSSLAVHAGEHVSGGERVGAVGTTGERSAAAPHLHFGVREAGTRHAYVDPLSLLPPPAASPPPGPAPHPAPAPAPLTPRPAPAPVPSGTPKRRPHGAPRRLPAPRGAPRPRPAPGRAPRPAPAPLGAPVPLDGPKPAPDPRGALRQAPGALRAPQVAPAPGGAARFAPAPAVGPGQAPGAQHTPVHSMLRKSAPPAASGPGGPDIGWALACAGLLLAAGILGLTDDGRKATARGGSRLAGALRPLLGKR